jgi:cold shock protein
MMGPARDRESVVMTTGTVQRYDTSHGFGFINPDDGGPEVFVHQSVLGHATYKGLMVGQRVVFEVESGSNGPRAKSVRSSGGRRR